MKKAFGYFTFILFLFLCAASFDMVRCDGNLFLNQLFGVDNTYIEGEAAPRVTPDIEKVGFGDNPYATDVSASEPEEEKISELPQFIEPEEISDEELAKMDAERGYEYYFSQLNAEEKEIYRVIYKAFSEIGSGNVLPSSDEDKLEKVIFCVKNDHPEFFYAQELGYVHYTLHDQIQSTTLAVTYSESKVGIDLKKDAIDKEADRILSGISMNASDYEKVKYVFEVIIRETDYDIASEDNQNITSVFLNHKSVCAGYARAVQYLLNKLDVPTTFVEGVTSDGSNHAWNMCLMDGAYYYVDATWGDSSFTSNKLTSKETIELVNYDYLCITTEELQRTHHITSSVGFPECTAKDNNYYVREGLLFTEYDEAKLQAIFDNAYAENKEVVAIKCDNLNLYDMMETDLIRKEMIFKYLKKDMGTLSYMTDEEQRTLCFWL